MHFFNPVHAMPLVEVIRGAKTSPEALATVVAYAVAMGKTPIVVRDGPGFLVNRILTAYMIAFLELVRDGADFARVDAVMEAFGWPMGPAYLNDVIGMDTGSHVFDVICAGFPQRLQRPAQDAARVLVERQRFGQKNGVGFYQYEVDPAGKPKKSISAESREMIAALQPGGPREFSDSEIVERMMLPMLSEAAWCLEDGTAGSAVEIDMSLLLGLGLPQYLGGALRYADWLGLDKVVQLSDRYASLGAHYVVPPGLRERAARKQRFYS
jgi:3-hydroxyacyl-CoA dehydrogenase/enoyl-CoA hydratase/3-hydroxybutyryl-CoA epimerase/enoyl-CoA isomerase